MSTMTLSLSDLEAGMLQGNQKALSLNGLFKVPNAVFAAAEEGMCSDCCGSNGNDCTPDPNDTYP